MITRYAVFNGTLKPGCDSDMRDFVTEKLTPLWRKFARAEDVQVLFGVENDPAGPTIPLVLAITYEDHEAMAEALESPARYQSRDLLPELYERFFEDVRLWHYVFDREQYPG